MPYPFTGYTADPNMYYNSTRPTMVYPEYATKDDVRNIIREELASFKSYNGKHYSPKNKEVE